MESDPAQPAPDALLVAGLGASAGGVEALEAFFAGLPKTDGVAFVVILHLAPNEESRLADVLQGDLPLPVIQVTEAVDLHARHVYVIPPGKNLLAHDGTLVLTPIEEERVRRRPIDHFFRTLAEAYGERAIGIVLSGTGANGTVGVQRLRETGGCVMAQDPADALFEEMPRSAIAAGVVDVVGPARALGAEVAAYAERVNRAPLADSPRELPEDGVRALQGVLAQLRARTGHDFAFYKRSTVLRRLDRRLHVTGAGSLADYLGRLRETPAEAEALLDDLLISVTNFFRDPEAFDGLADAVPGLFEGKRAEDEVRVWVPACATGEEAYSIAILLLEHAATLVAPPRIQVFATDLSERAVHTAREGRYPESIEADVTRERLNKFFAHESGHYRVTETLRETVVFAQHSLLSDPPFSRLDLVSCRNLLIYFQRELQQRVLALFHYSLRPDGLLFLGASETVGGGPDLFHADDKHARLYRRRDVETPLPQLPRVTRVLTEAPAGPRPDAPAPPVPPADEYEQIHRAVREEEAAPSVLVGESDDVVHVSNAASEFLQVGAGTPTRALTQLIRPELRAVALTAVVQARREGEAGAGPVALAVEGAERRVEVHARRAPSDLVHLAFRVLPPDASASPPELDARAEAEMEEHRRTREQLRVTVEEFEASKEELRAQNEELHSVNEELRSTAEELETAKEEAQSMAEELRTVNDELKAKVEETARARGDLENLVVSTEIATLFLDRDLRIQRFTPHVREHFHVLASDVGRPLADLAQKFGGGRLVEDAEAVVERLEVKEREVEGEDGRWYLVQARPYRSQEDRIEGVVVTFVDITRRKADEEALRHSEERYRLLVQSATEYAILALDPEGQIMAWNQGAERVFGYAAEEVLGKPGAFLFTEEDREAGVPEREMATAAEKGRAPDDRWLVRRGGERFWASGVMTALHEPGGTLRGFAKILRDDTQRREAEQALRASETRYRALFTSMQEGFCVIEMVFDESGEPTDYRFVETNPAFEPHSGLADAVGETARTLVPGLEDHWVEVFARVARTGQAEQFEQRSEAMGRWFQVDAFQTGDPAHQRVGVLFTDITQRRQSEEALRLLNATLAARVAEQTAQVRTLSVRLVAAEQDERERIARVLHDDLQQQLYGLGVTLDLMQPPEDDPARALHAQAREILRESTELTRSLAMELSPTVLSGTSAESLLRWVAERKQNRLGLDVEVETEGDPDIRPPHVRVLLYHVLRELLLNVAKHAGTDRATLRAWAEAGDIIVRVEDEGVGIDPEAAAGSDGFGLPYLRERVRLVGGSFEVEPAPEVGTRATVRLPLAEESDSAPGEA